MGTWRSGGQDRKRTGQKPNSRQDSQALPACLLQWPASGFLGVIWLWLLVVDQLERQADLLANPAGALAGFAGHRR